MKQKKIYDAITNVPDELIEEAEKAKFKKTKPSFGKWVWIAAAATLTVVAIAIIPKLTNDFSKTNVDTSLILPEPEFDSDNLPKLNIEFESGGMGFEGLMAYDISELENGNPWTVDNDLTVMPVFRTIKNSDMSAEEMLAKVTEIAETLKLEINETYTEPTQQQIELILEKLEAVDASEDEILAQTTAKNAVAKCDGAVIQFAPGNDITMYLSPEKWSSVKKYLDKLVTDNYQFTIQFNETPYSDIGISIPDSYSFTYDETSYEQALITTDYLLDEYGSFMGIKSPGFNLMADYNIYEKQTRIYNTAFENSGSLTERILNYHFNNINFSPNESSQLTHMRCNRTDLSDLIGYYPIITTEQAQEQLLSGKYITTVPYELTGAETPAKVELIYRNARNEETIIPYYRFYIEVPEMNNYGDLKTFGAYYVPAVHPDYLENVTLWDGSFN